MVLQDPNLYDTTIYDNVASGLKIRGGMSRSEIKSRVTTYLERFNLSHMAHRHARKLSGGEARRVSLARAFAVEPDMIFFDEPFANLDPPTRQTLSMDMVKIIRETGISSILVTHDQTEALRLSDRIVVMNKGRIVQSGT
jgi:tungstate transport system ATP-binding protein